MISLVIDEHLRFIFQAAKGAGMDDPVAVALEAGAVAAFRLGMHPAKALVRAAGVGRQRQGTVIIGRGIRNRLRHR